ncbi:unnamed protein product [Urochloa decumbens]|uniref:Phospholipase/carboxylesterase/thioesterase domain-containing protein n=1 Tax=Urochloa decumbens TaxID=240449 RepID=A0ABC9C3G6_9POAL
MGSLVRLLFTLAAAVGAAALLAASLRRRAPPSGLPAQAVSSSHMAGRSRSFVLWLHGLGDSGPANEPIRNFFSAPEFRLTKWSFPSAPRSPVSCNNGFVMPSWFDIHELPISAGSPQDESGVLKAVEKVHAMIDKEVADGIHPDNIFVCGFSQGGALTLASVLLYPKKLGGGAVFSGPQFFGRMEWLTEQYCLKLVKLVHRFCKAPVLTVNSRHILILVIHFPKKSCFILSHGSRVV